MYDNGMYYAAMMAAIQAVFNLSITWFIVYVLLGSLVKVGLIRFMNKDLEPRSRRFWPVLLAHFIFSILFVNPYTLWIVGNLADEMPILLLLLIYLIILPVLLDILFLRIIPRIKLFRWLLWTPPLKQVIIINVVICLVSFIAAAWVARVL